VADLTVDAASVEVTMIDSVAARNRPFYPYVQVAIARIGYGHSNIDKITRELMPWQITGSTVTI
jgi:hypothetical protein